MDISGHPFYLSFYFRGGVHPFQSDLFPHELMGSNGLYLSLLPWNILFALQYSASLYPTNAFHKACSQATTPFPSCSSPNFSNSLYTFIACTVSHHLLFSPYNLDFNFISDMVLKQHSQGYQLPSDCQTQTAISQSPSSSTWKEFDAMGQVFLIILFLLHFYSVNGFCFGCLLLIHLFSHFHLPCFIIAHLCMSVQFQFPCISIFLSMALVITQILRIPKPDISKPGLFLELQIKRSSVCWTSLLRSSCLYLNIKTSGHAFLLISLYITDYTSMSQAMTFHIFPHLLIPFVCLNQHVCFITVILIVFLAILYS